MKSSNKTRLYNSGQVTQNPKTCNMLHKYNNSSNTNSFSLNTNYIDDFDKNLLYNSMYPSKTRRSSSSSSISSIPYSIDQSRRSSVGSINSETAGEPFHQQALSTNKNTSKPQKKDQSWLLLLILGA